MELKLNYSVDNVLLFSQRTWNQFWYIIPFLPKDFYKRSTKTIVYKCALFAIVAVDTLTREICT